MPSSSTAFPSLVVRADLTVQPPETLAHRRGSRAVAAEYGRYVRRTRVLNERLQVVSTEKFSDR
jgi:hypothetical protein